MMGSSPSWVTYCSTAPSACELYCMCMVMVSVSSAAEAASHTTCVPSSLSAPDCLLPLMRVSVLSMSSLEPNSFSKDTSEPGPASVHTPSSSSPASAYTPSSCTTTFTHWSLTV